MSSRPLVLASASPARLALLQGAGFTPTVVVSGVQEPAFDGGDPTAYVRGLAELKARAVVAQAPSDALVIGCDSMLELDGEVLGKPGTPEVAAERWLAMRGKQGRLLTGHCVVDVASRELVADVGVTVVHFGEPSEEEIAAYVRTGEPLGVAGAFTLDGRGGAFVTGIQGCHGNVIGLSLPLLRGLLAQLGVAIHDLWAQPLPPTGQP